MMTRLEGLVFDGRLFELDGEPFYIGVSDITQGCMVATCDHVVLAGWESFVTAVGSTQDVVCRACGKDLILQGRI